jgi:hypothetical protein
MSNAERPFNNPYAQKRAPPELCRKPLYNVPAYSADEDEDEQPPFETTTRPPVVATNASTSSTTSNATITASSINLPQWQRLPSKNLSFGSCEILSVKECMNHGESFKSVRVTGVLLERHVNNDATVSLKLGDPCSISLSPPKEKTPLTRKRQWPGTAQKATSTSTTSTTPAKSENQACIWVRANPLHVSVDHSIIGDLVLVMGEMQQETSGNIIQARILRNANGTNMKLQHNALMARRNLLKGNSQGCGPPSLTTVANY